MGESHSTGWTKALLIGLGVGVLLAVVLLVVPHWIVKVLPLGGRPLRVGLTTGWMAVVTMGLIAVGGRLGRDRHADASATPAWDR